MKRIVKVLAIVTGVVVTIAAGAFAVLCWLFAMEEYREFREYLDNHNC